MTFPQPLPTVPKTTLVKDLITYLGWPEQQETQYPLFSGPEILDMPDRALFITPTAGPGWLTEEAAVDVWGFQARLRGPSDDPDTPALAIAQLDVMLLNGPYNVTVDGVLVKLVTRAGGTPVPLPLDPQDRRTEYTCTYLITTALE